MEHQLRKMPKTDSLQPESEAKENSVILSLIKWSNFGDRAIQTHPDDYKVFLPEHMV